MPSLLKKLLGGLRIMQGPRAGSNTLQLNHVSFHVETIDLFDSGRRPYSEMSLFILACNNMQKCCLNYEENQNTSIPLGECCKHLLLLWTVYFKRICCMRLQIFAIYDNIQSYFPVILTFWIDSTMSCANIAKTAANKIRCMILLPMQSLFQ